MTQCVNCASAYTDTKVFALYLCTSHQFNFFGNEWMLNFYHKHVPLRIYIYIYVYNTTVWNDRVYNICLVCSNGLNSYSHFFGKKKHVRFFASHWACVPSIAVKLPIMSFLPFRICRFFQVLCSYGSISGPFGLALSNPRGTLAFIPRHEGRPTHSPC